MPATTSRVDVPPARSRPLPGRIRDTFLAPGRLFATFGGEPPWVGAMLVATAIAAVAVAAEPAQFYLDQMEGAVSRRGTPVEITSPPEQIVLWGRVMAIFSALAGHPLIGFAAAGLLTLVFRVIGRGDATFRQYLAVSAHALLIVSAGMVAAVLLRLALGGPEALPTIGTFSGAGRDGALGRVLHGINLFTLWTLVVLAIGVAAVERRVTRSAATTLLLGAYLLAVVTGAYLFRG